MPKAMITFCKFADTGRLGVSLFMAVPCSKDVEHDPPKAVLLFRATWDHIPVPILKWVKYLPMNPFKRMLNLNNLFKEYGKQMLREQGPDVDAERKVNGKDVMSLLSTSYPQCGRSGRHDLTGLISSQGEFIGRRQNALG